MYGGHITDDWDRYITNAYLAELICEQYLEGGGEICPGYPIPPPSPYPVIREYIEESTPEESPAVFGLHANAEIGFLTNQSDLLMSVALEFAPMVGGAGGGEGEGSGAMSADEMTREYLNSMVEKTGELRFDLIDMNGRVDDDQKASSTGPYFCDCLQECERMEKLLILMRASFTELDKGLKGELSMNPRMEALVVSFQMDQQYGGWNKFNFISQKGLSQWTVDLIARCKQLDAWQAEFQVPRVTWLSGMFNPQAFINAVIQSTARKNFYPLDRMTTNTDVMKKHADEIAMPPRDGAYINGLYRGRALGHGSQLHQGAIPQGHEPTDACHPPQAHHSGPQGDQGHVRLPGVHHAGPWFTATCRNICFCSDPQVQGQELGLDQGWSGTYPVA